MAASDLEHVPTLNIRKKLTNRPARNIMRIYIEIISLKKQAFQAAMSLKMVLEDWSTSKPCISVIYPQDLRQDVRQGFPNKYSVILVV